MGCSRSSNPNCARNVARGFQKAGPQILSTAADFTPIVGDIKGAIEFAQDPTVLGAIAVIVGIVQAVGDLIGKGLKRLDNNKIDSVSESIGDFLGDGDKTIAHYGNEGENISITNANKDRRVRLEFSEKNDKDITPHAHVQIKKNGEWVAAPGSPDHINFKGG